MKNLQSTTTLHNGVRMPWFGLGVFKVEEGAELEIAVATAIQNGYRSMDTAAIYGNEAGVGRGIEQGLRQAGIDRSELFVTSKVWNADLGYESTLAAYETSLSKLGLEYLDLYLIHWPVEGRFVEAWRALEHLYEQGRVKAIGVSNFQPHHIETLMQAANIKPMVNQVEYHPRLAQLELRNYCVQQGIQLEAWSPLMQGQLLDNPLLLQLAAKYDKSVAQIILRWDLQTGVVTIPKSTNEARIMANAAIFDFELSEADMELIAGMNENVRVGPDPDHFDF
ncbi:diketogulonate reductase-like aldo/keto reductase [Paenibacillus endophyticus]|uniref:Diketogulonate reductase-like aldo/keto reductase n=1 Tax=Paenibacillus endophyticus TaxID=1294268 RepID=A0A7W5GA50_9BACL|nr:aldo/keto reductase [Paenibacillus endophyticus]MBB3151943.1 diketogulonate reductase-like aldo/keto reductase [Paenibacillus endophyticus]